MQEELPIIEPEIGELALNNSAYWVISSVVLLLLFLIGFLVFHIRKRSSFKREALSRLAAVNLESKEALVQINTILKWTVLQSFSRVEIASLSGEAWLNWCNKKCEKKPFDATLITLVSELIYNPNAQVKTSDLRKFKQAAATFIKYHAV